MKKNRGTSPITRIIHFCFGNDTLNGVGNGNIGLRPLLFIMDFASFWVSNRDFRLQPYGGYVPVRHHNRATKKYDYLHKNMDIERVTRQTRA